MGTISNDNLNDFLGEVREKAKGEEKLLEQFERCFLNTLETTVKMKEDGTVYVITGDIPAMWLRDSTAQIRPFLFPAKQNGEIQKMIAGLVKRQFNYICLDPYANAFNEGPTGACWEKDDPDQSPWVWERKFEVDSLCYPIQLAWMLWKNTGCTEQFEGNFRTGARKILNVFCTEQNHDPNLRPPLWSSLDLAKEQMEYGFGYCDILKISDNEIRFVSGKEDYDEGIAYLQEKYNIPLILLAMGKDGSRAYYKGMRVERPGFTVKAIETTGAGDTFCGSSLNYILEHDFNNLTEDQLGEMLTFANAAAALITMKKGAIRAMPEREEVLDLIRG